MRPTINFDFQTYSRLPIVCTNCSIVPSLFHFTVLTFLVFYITVQNFTTSQVSQPTFPNLNAKWIPVLINKIWYYRMHQKSSQVVPEQIQTLYFKCPSFSAIQCCSKGPVMSWSVFSLLHSQSPSWGLAALAFKD